MRFATRALLFLCVRCRQQKLLLLTQHTPVHTVGSYLLYVIGIFLACVYMLGPRTKFGHLEQAPEYWLILLLVAKGGWIQDPVGKSDGQSGAYQKGL